MGRRFCQVRYWTDIARFPGAAFLRPLAYFRLFLGLNADQEPSRDQTFRPVKPDFVAHPRRQRSACHGWVEFRSSYCLPCVIEPKLALSHEPPVEPDPSDINIACSFA